MARRPTRPGGPPSTSPIDRYNRHSALDYLSSMEYETQASVASVIPSGVCSQYSIRESGVCRC